MTKTTYIQPGTIRLCINTLPLQVAVRWTGFCILLLWCNNANPCRCQHIYNTAITGIEALIILVLRYCKNFRYPGERNTGTAIPKCIQYPFAEATLTISCCADRKRGNCTEELLRHRCNISEYGLLIVLTQASKLESTAPKLCRQIWKLLRYICWWCVLT